MVNQYLLCSSPLVINLKISSWEIFKIYSK